MATLATSMTECACGFSFEQEDAQPSSEEIRIKAEELYENYLAARAEQAAKSVKTAQAEYTRDLNNPAKSKNIARCLTESRTAEANLVAQRSHIAELRKLMRTVPAVIETPIQVAPRKPVVARPVAVTPIQTVVRTLAPAVSAPKPERMEHNRFAVRSPNANFHVATPVKQATVPTPAVTAAQPAIPILSTPSAIPDKAFREAQAAKAAKIMRATTPAETQTRPLRPTEPVIEAVSAPAPVSAPPKPAATRKPMLLRATTDKECPNCTATVSVNTERCRCGYEFAPGGSLIPELSMTEEERAAFARIFV
jgi:hypothetical protein